MESDSIVEGLHYLESVHQVRCTRLVGDGDSNTMSKIQESISYGGRVLKVECANHAVRRYSRALERLQKSTSRFAGKMGIQARKTLKAKLPKLVNSARTTIKVQAALNHSHDTKEKIDALVAALRNIPHHVFGDHVKCEVFCTKKNENLFKTQF